MAPLPDRPLPPDPRCIVLINPTKYLGNLLLAGALIQEFAALCRRQNREFTIVLDAAFQDLCSKAFADVDVLWYPRQAIRSSRSWWKLRQWLDFVRRLRGLRADLAFNVEEDGLTSRLTQLSGARFRLGCSPVRHRFAYDRVLPLQYGSIHRWQNYREVFKAVGFAGLQQPRYLNLLIEQPDAQLIQKLHEAGRPSAHPLVAIHPAASKDYKRWPESAFIKLCKLLIQNDFTPALIGAGQHELARCNQIQQEVVGSGQIQLINLCNRLSLAELAGFFRLCHGIVGNDSGPSHLASAQQLPGVVVFGPSEPNIWKPLGERTHVMRKAELCDPGCSRRSCLADYRCLQAIHPEEVFDVLDAEMRRSATP